MTPEQLNDLIDMARNMDLNDGLPGAILDAERIGYERARKEAATVCNEEKLIGADELTSDDRSYNMAIRHCCEAIERLKP